MSATTTTMTMTMTMGKPCVRARAKATRATRASGRRSVAVNASKKYDITILPGDGIGPEIMKVATAALEVAGKKADVEARATEALVGGSAIDATGTPLPDETLETCKASDAVLLAAIGGYKWDDLPSAQRPEQGLLGLRWLGCVRQPATGDGVAAAYRRVDAPPRCC